MRSDIWDRAEKIQNPFTFSDKHPRGCAIEIIPEQSLCYLFY